ncbi:uncharacterized protein B0T23DRAFT_447708 [Neurospora hispaniola]|uniref:Uncharacterized protein n=1 Tax=Neurospora hispaniola TaxID=588809 RepID=A0AAJ0MN06_9PEZI|nr:hypothetical protein B0T23DRAFT_447708 [Neurospora hispaniola]
MGESNDEKSMVTNSKAAAKEVTNPANKITPAARILQHILSSRSLLIMRKTMILEALNQAENEAEKKVEAALAREDDLKLDEAMVNKDNDKDNDKDNKAISTVTTRSGRVVKPTRKTREMNEAADKKKTSTSKADTRTRTRTRTRSGKGGKGGAARSMSAPPAATVNTTITRSGRVVKPSLKAREMAGWQNKK